MRARSARGGAYCDYDNDGDIDLVVSNIDEVPQLLANAGGNRQNWLEMKLTSTKSNRDAIGARVKVSVGSLVQYDHVRAGGSYISGNDVRLHFGLANNRKADTVEVTWPSGTVEKIENVRANQIIEITEGRGIGSSRYKPLKIYSK